MLNKEEKELIVAALAFASTQDVVADFTQVQAMSGRTKNVAATTGACHNFTLRWLELMFRMMPWIRPGML